jgi:hypothetical protein
MKSPQAALVSSRLAACVGLFWAVINAWLTAVIIDVGERPGYACTGGQPEPGIVVVTAGIVAAAIAAFGLAVRGRPRAVLCAVAAEAALVVVWSALGRFAAFDCALDI